MIEIILRCPVGSIGSGHYVQYFPVKKETGAYAVHLVELAGHLAGGVVRKNVKAYLHLVCHIPEHIDGQKGNNAGYCY
jgi:hypothetical protein